MENHETSYVCALAEKAVDTIRQDPRTNSSFSVFIFNFEIVERINYAGRPGQVNHNRLKVFQGWVSACSKTRRIRSKAMSSCE